MTTTRRDFLKMSMAAGAAALMPAQMINAAVAAKQKKQIPIGICASIQFGKALMAMGYDFIEPTVDGLLCPGKHESQFLENLRFVQENNISLRSLVNFLPGSMRITGKEANHEPIIQWAETAYRRAQMVGIKSIVFGSGGARAIPAGYPYHKASEQFVDLLKRLGPLARKYDITMTIEPLSVKEVNFFHTVAEGLEICKKVNHPNIRLLADFYHMANNDESPEILLQCKSYLRHCHAAEVNTRRVAGNSDFDFRPYFNALEQIKYKGGVSFECNWKTMIEEAGPGLIALKKQLGYQ